MKIQKIENNKQKLIIISLIVSDKFCDRIIPILMQNKDLIYQTFTDFYKIVLRWVIDYYNNYSKAPHNHIKEIYDDKKKVLDEDEQGLISQFLQHLSDQYEREDNYNENYVIDQALKYLREVNLNILQKKINDAKETNNIDEAEKLILTYNKLDEITEIKQETFLFQDIDKAVEVCNYKPEDNPDRLFKFPGDIGNKIGWIYRGDFFSFVSPAKRGKSYYLRETALIAAMYYGLNVIILNLEMSHNKYTRNFYQNITGEVKKYSGDKKIKKVRVPYFEEGRNNKFDIKYEELNKYGLTGKKVRNIFRRSKIKSRGEILIRSFPSNTLIFQKLNKVLDDLVLKGFVPDLILIDFLDNMKVYEKGEHRHSIDTKWTNARRLAQEKHLAVGTVSHTSKKNFKVDIGQGDVNEDYRKENHVTHMIALNQTPEEKEKQVLRMNILHNRDEDFNPKEFFVSLECRDIARVMIDNKRKSFINYKK